LRLEGFNSKGKSETKITIIWGLKKDTWGGISSWGKFPRHPIMFNRDENIFLDYSYFAGVHTSGPKEPGVPKKVAYLGNGKPVHRGI